MKRTKKKKELASRGERTDGNGGSAIIRKSEIAFTHGGPILFPTSNIVIEGIIACEIAGRPRVNDNAPDLTTSRSKRAKREVRNCEMKY